MKKTEDSPAALFARLVQQLQEAGAETSPHREGFGTGSMFVGRKMFGLLDDSGALVVKLPPARVQAVISAGEGRPWHPGKGTPLKEYVAIGFDQRSRWLALAKEARAYMAQK